MAIRQIHPITTEGDHEKRIRELERLVRKLASPGTSSVNIFTADEIADLEVNNGAVWLGSDDGSFNYYLNGVAFTVLGTP